MTNVTSVPPFARTGFLLAWATLAALAIPAPEFFKRSCQGCHNAQVQSGNLDLTTLPLVSADPERWERILRRITAGDMPPPSMPRTAAADVQSVQAYIEGELTRVAKSAKPAPGIVSARRLNRTEYNNTIRDLLGLDLKAANDFPEDNSAYGFDNIAGALSLSPLQMEKYLAAAESISRLAVFGPEIRKVSTTRYTPTLPRRMETNPVVLTEPPFYTPSDYDVTGLSIPGAFHKSHRFPATGEYQFKFFPNGTRPAGSEKQLLQVYVDGKLAQTMEVRSERTVTNEVVPVAHEFRMKLTAGYHQIDAAFPNLMAGLPPSFNGPNPSQLPQPPPPDPEKFLPPLPKDPTPAQLKEREARIARFRERFSKPKFDGLAVGTVEIIGPFDFEKGPYPEVRRRLFVCNPAGNPGCERTIVSNLVSRAFRRPVSTAEVNEFLALAKDARGRGRTFDQSVALVLQAVLVSPDFLFRIERAPAQSAEISQHELAARLSYFLWSSMPDDALRAAATRGTLRANLRTQVRRMMADPKAEGFVTNFTGQWLETRRLEGAQPDRDRFPDFDDHLRESMTRETELFFADLLRRDRPVIELVTADYTFLNERLARHYKIPGILGQEFRRVPRDGAGLLTHASVLTVSSYNNRTSPVLRGKWILENLLNEPPPPPPPAVPALDENAVGATGTLREQMEKHRANAVCASCHSRMDPLGFALENFNAVGLYRTHDGKFPIDPSGALPSGQKLSGAAGVRDYLAAHPDTFARALIEKLFIYSTGRGVEPSDRPALRAITAKAAAGRYAFSGIIMGIIESAAFQMRKGTT